LLLLPRQSERVANDWFSLLNANLTDIPTFDAAALVGQVAAAPEEVANGQDQATWEAEAAVIAATRRSIVWRSPSRHEGGGGDPDASDEGVFVGEDALSESIPTETQRDDEKITIKGGRERGLVIHKLLEEVLTGETPDSPDSLETRANLLLSELGIARYKSAEEGPYAPEMAASVRRGLEIPAVAALRPRLLPEVTVFSANPAGQDTVFVGGVADALALGDGDQVEVVVDWKSDVDPAAAVVDLYREQVRDYLAATGGKEGLLVFVTGGHVERVLPR
jgi:exodeoxyribonuclease-5